MSKDAGDTLKGMTHKRVIDFFDKSIKELEGKLEDKDLSTKQKGKLEAELYYLNSYLEKLKNGTEVALIVKKKEEKNEVS